MGSPRIPRDEPLHPVVTLVGLLVLSGLCWTAIYELWRLTWWAFQ